MIVKSVIALGLLVLFLGVAGCRATAPVDTRAGQSTSLSNGTEASGETQAPTKGAGFDVQSVPQTKNSQEIPPAEKKQGQLASNEPDKATVTYSGTVLAGTASPVIDFNKSDYDKALAAKKNVVLYFYANWCPICRVEVPRMYDAFNSLQDANLVAFRVNYNDSDTDDTEKELARQFGVAYQHTKVFLKNGERVLKSPESWDKARYLSEIEKAF